MESHKVAVTIKEDAVTVKEDIRASFTLCTAKTRMVSRALKALAIAGTVAIGLALVNHGPPLQPRRMSEIMSQPAQMNEQMEQHMHEQMEQQINSQAQQLEYVEKADQRPTKSTLNDQVFVTMQNLESQLETLGLDKSNITSVVVYLADIADIGEFNVHYADYMHDIEHLPAMAAIQTVTPTLPDGQLLEMKILAYPGESVSTPGLQISASAAKEQAATGVVVRDQLRKGFVLPFSPVIQIGDVITMAGVEASDLTGNYTGFPDTASQTARILEIIEIDLSKLGLTFQDVVSVETWLNKDADYSVYRTALGAVFESACNTFPPFSEMPPVKEHKDVILFGQESQLVEIAMVASSAQDSKCPAKLDPSDLQAAQTFRGRPTLL